MNDMHQDLSRHENTAPPDGSKLVIEEKCD